MKKKMLIIPIIGILLLTSCYLLHTCVSEKTGTYINNNDKIEFIDDIYGVYGDDDGAMYKSVVEVFKGRDENHIDINAYFYRTASFYLENIEIKKNKAGEIIASKKIHPDDDNDVWDYFVEDQYLEDAKVDIILNHNNIKLEFNKDLKLLNKKIEEPKINVKCITEDGKKRAINNILDSNFKDINEDVFEIIHDTKNYLVVRIKNYIYNESTRGKNYNIEGSDSIGMYKYYNIDKKNKKVLGLNDIIKNVDNLNEYINKSIANKRDAWLKDNPEMYYWEYEEFKGIGKVDYFEHYFEIDEDKKVVKIRCLGYPNEAMRALGDLIIDVPFSFFELEQ